MPTSETVSQTEIENYKILEHCFRRCGVSPAEASPDSWQAASEILYFYLSALSNDGINLWTVEKNILGTYPGQSVYPVGPGTVDVRNALRRTVTNLPNGATLASSAGGDTSSAFDRNTDTSFTQSSSNGILSASSSSDFTITTVGFMPNGDNYYSPVWEYSFDEVSWTQCLAVPSQKFLDRNWYCYDIPYPKSCKNFRMRETSGGTLNLREVIFGQVQLEIIISRINFNQYTNLTNKSFNSQVQLQYWLNRKLDNPEMNVWPVPQTYWEQIVVWRTRYIKDVGKLSNTLEIPQRWIDAIIANASLRMIFEIPGADTTRYPILKAEADAATFRAQQEERDKSPIQLAPNISPYTR